MKISSGRALFFETVAQGLLQLLPAIPNNIALFFKDPEDLIQYNDRVSIAEALYRICKFSTAYVSLIKFEDLSSSDINPPFIIDACGKSTQEVFDKINDKSNLIQNTIIFNHSENSKPTLVEIPFDIRSEKYLIEEATRRLFVEAKLDYEPLAVYRYINNGGFSIFHSQYSLFEEESHHDFSADPKRLEMFCHNVARNWIFHGKLISGSAVYDWVMQFKQEGFLNEVCHLLLFLKREGFVTLQTVQENLRRILNDHKEKTNADPLYIAIQPMGKSESLLSYALRPHINLKTIEAALKMVKEKQIDPQEFICFDDVIVSGGSMLKYLFNPQYNKLSSELINNLRNKKINITIISSHADINGIKKITDDPRTSGAVEVKAAKIINDNCRVFSIDSNIVPDKSQIELFKAFCKKIGKKLTQSIPLGWDNAQWCIVLDYTVPNGTVPILWASSKEHGWQALFKRERTTSCQHNRPPA